MPEGGIVTLRGWATACAILLSLVAIPVSGPDETITSITDQGPSIVRLFGYFTENRGQLVNEDVRFYGGLNGVQVGFVESGILLMAWEASNAPIHAPSSHDALLDGGPAQQTEFPARGILLRITFEGADRVLPQGRHELPHQSHFFLGNDPANWRTGVRSYGEVVYENLYNGIDLVLRSAQEGLKYDFVVQPGADPHRITVVYEGGESLRLSPDGGLSIHTSIGDFTDSAPYSHQDGDEIRCAFVLRGPWSYGFDCESWDASRALVIDPLIYSTFLGGSSLEWGHSVKVDSGRNAYITGGSGSRDFPTTPGVFTTPNSVSMDVFVSKLDAAGTALVFSTYFGGSSSERGNSIAVDSSGNVYVTGRTYSSDFPTTPSAFDATHNGWNDVFVTKLDPTGSTLVYSTFIGGSYRDGDDPGSGIAVDSSGSAYVSSQTGSIDFPTTVGAYDTTFNGGPRDAFVSKLNPSGSDLVYSTFLGGASWDWGISIGVDSAGNAYATGGTSSTDFPTTLRVLGESHNGGIQDTFVTKLSVDGGALVYSTFLGGSDVDYGFSLALDSVGSAYVLGHTRSTDFPVTPNAYQTSLGGVYDTFVGKLDAAGSALIYATLLGGSSSDAGFSVAVDPAGHAYVTGHTLSPDFPITPGAFDTTLNGVGDAFVGQLNAEGSDLVYSTFLGGSGNDFGRSVAVDSTGSLYVTGIADSVDFPVTLNAFDPSHNGNRDAFVAKLDMAPEPVDEVCPLTQGFWKNHSEDWPMDSLGLGSETYDKTELLDLLRTPPKGDASLILAHQLIATKLNVADGSDDTVIATEMAKADALLTSYAEKLPYGVKPSSSEGRDMMAIAEILDRYNNGDLTPGCGGS